MATEHLTSAREHLTATREYLKAIRRSLAAVRCSVAALRFLGFFPVIHYLWLQNISEKNLVVHCVESLRQVDGENISILVYSKKIPSYLVGAVADSTPDRYIGAFKCFRKFCETNNVPCLRSYYYHVLD